VIFDPQFADGMIRGHYTLYFKPHNKKKPPKVEKGKHYPVEKRNPDGGRPLLTEARIVIKSVKLVRFSEITWNDSRAAGFSDLLDLERKFARAAGLPDGMKMDPDAYYWRIEWRLVGDADRTDEEREEDEKRAREIEAALEAEAREADAA